MMDRKHRLEDPSSGVPNAKKIALDATSAPNGDLAADSAVDEGLESFRKEAIWRQMQEYKREAQRASEEALALQEKLKEAEAGAAAIDASWTTLVLDLQSVLPEAAAEASSTLGISHQPGLSAKRTANGISDFLPRNVSLDALRKALEGRFSQTKQLFARLSASSPSTSQQGRETEELRSRCHQLSAETAHTQAALSALQDQLERAKEDLERQHAQLLVAEKRVDRIRSKTVQEMEAKAQAKKAEAEDDMQEDKPTVKTEAKDDPAKSAAAVPAHAVPVDESELIELREVAAKRQKEIEGLHTSRIELQKTLDGLSIQLANIPESSVVDSVPFQQLQGRLASLEQDLERARFHSQEANAEADGLREQQNEFRETAIKEAHITAEDLSKRCTRYETDLARIRDQREALKAEIAELKARDAETLQSVGQIRTLANSRQDRIAALGSEVRRLQMQIKAREGNMEMVEALSLGESEVQVAEYQKRLKDAETLAIALRDQIKNYSSAAGNAELVAMIRSETGVREELIRVKERLGQLERVLAVDSNADVEVSKLVKAAQEQEERIKVLEATVKSKEMGEEMLLGEVERMASAWQVLDEQNRDKVLQLVTLEEKQQRLTQEKVKADNRYFAAMRSKESIQQEAAVGQKTIAGQNKTIEALQSERIAVIARHTALEKEVTLHQQNNRAYQDRISQLELELKDRTLAQSGTEIQLTQLNTLLNERTTTAETKSASAQQLEEQVSKLKRELDNAKTTNKAMSRKGGVDEDLRSTNEDLLKMLKCTSCNIRFKTHVITRCYHLLCKECIEGRINNRQRKCPSCAAPFGAQDYQQVYF